MTSDLSFKQRIVAVAIYASLLFLTLYYTAGSIGPMLDGTSAFGKIFLSGGLLLIFGAYIAEPFFTKPTDVLVNATGITLFLLGIEPNVRFVGQEALLACGILLIVLSVVFILLGQFRGRIKMIDGAVRLLVLVGQSRVAYSAIYLATLVTYFRDDKVGFAVLFTFWAIFISGFVVEKLVLYVSNILTSLRRKTLHVGRVIGHENAFVLKVESDQKNSNTLVAIGDLIEVKLENQNNIGLVVQRNALMNRDWITIYLLSSTEPKSDSSFSWTGTPDTIASKVNLSDIVEPLKSQVENHELYKNRDRIAGYVTEESNINRIKFRVFGNENGTKISEGVIVTTSIGDTPVLYQVLDGVTKGEELNGHDQDTFIVGIARKLGVYDKEKKEIISEKWVPQAYSPVYLLEDKTDPVVETDIGQLPGTDFALRIVNYDALVTHNTAILGILGVGKSCLTFELVQKALANTGTKVICLDITGQYQDKDEGLPRYVNKALMNTSLVTELNGKLEGTKEAAKKNPKDSAEEGGNVALLRELLAKGVGDFMSSEQRILIINPEEISAIRQEDQPKKRKVGEEWIEYAPFAELSIAEITRVISEVALTQCKQGGIQKEAKLLLVYEEAHSLIPEWNSAANEGDKGAANGTARVILQGRKYGLGSLVVTQRTANISKSILNQCNTIFALRVFDDTGKQFLENYIGSDFSNVLPTLEDRHAILIGKALKLKQPVIARLNNRELVMLNEDGTDGHTGGGVVLTTDAGVTQ